MAKKKVKVLIKKTWLPRKTTGITNRWILVAKPDLVRDPSGNVRDENKIAFFYRKGHKDAWFIPYDTPWDNTRKVILGQYFEDWQRPTLLEDVAFEIETGYSLQKIFKVTIPEDY